MPRSPLLVLAILGLLASCLVAVRARSKEPKPFAPGEVTECSTPGGVSYAVYVPKGWKKREPLPLIVHVPMERHSAEEGLRSNIRRNLVREPQGPPVPAAVICTILLEAHNKESGYQRGSPDVPRFLKLLDRDAAAVLTVIDDLAERLPIRKDRVILSGYRHTADVAMGVAARHPERFAGVVLKDVRTIAWWSDGVHHRWGVVPEGPASAGETLKTLPVVVSYDGTGEDGAGRAEQNAKIRAWFEQQGFRRLTFFATKEWSYGKWVLAESFRRLFAALKPQDERDDLLKQVGLLAETGKLSRALKAYVRARDLEATHGLGAAGQEVYDRLQAMGRKMLAEADALPPSKRTAEYGKVLRLFKGTPFEEEIKAALEAAGPSRAPPPRGETEPGPPPR